MARTQYHVTPDGGGGWQVTVAGSGARVAGGRTQSAAELAARAIAKDAEPSQVVIHRPDGRFREEHTYGNDPEKYPG